MPLERSDGYYVVFRTSDGYLSL
eukprot:COSAG03_NODE_1832_length_3457_cov_153.246344_7_plen_22_part_01